MRDKFLIANERYLVYQTEMDGVQIIYLDNIKSIHVDIEGNDNDTDNVATQILDVVKHIGDLNL